SQDPPGSRGGSRSSRLLQPVSEARPVKSDRTAVPLGHPASRQENTSAVTRPHEQPAECIEMAVGESRARSREALPQTPQDHALGRERVGSDPPRIKRNLRTLDARKLRENGGSPLLEGQRRGARFAGRGPHTPRELGTGGGGVAARRQRRDQRGQ